jgi:predicted signal transduction protein with EAL and GGDEF domain
LNGHAAAGDASQLANRLLKEVSACYEIDGHCVAIGTSIGIALAPGDGSVAADIFRNADLALYVAKNNGRGSCSHYEPGMDASVRARRALEPDLRQAVETEAFGPCSASKPFCDGLTRSGVAFRRWISFHSRRKSA